MTMIVPCALRFGHRLKSAHYKENTVMLKKMLCRIWDLDGFFGMTKAMAYGHQMWHMKWNKTQ